MTVGAGLKLLIVRFDCVATVWRLRSRSAASFALAAAAAFAAASLCIIGAPALAADATTTAVTSPAALVWGQSLTATVADSVNAMSVPTGTVAFSGMHGPRSWAISIVLGLVGAFVGYLIFTRGLGIGDDDAFDLGGLVSAIIGVVIVLIIAGFVMRRTRRPAT